MLGDDGGRRLGGGAALARIDARRVRNDRLMRHLTRLDNRCAITAFGACDPDLRLAQREEIAAIAA